MNPRARAACGASYEDAFCFFFLCVFACACVSFNFDLLDLLTDPRKPTRADVADVMDSVVPGSSKSGIPPSRMNGVNELCHAQRSRVFVERTNFPTGKPCLK